MASEHDETATEPIALTASEILDVDGRIHVLERESREYRGHLVKFEDQLINQIMTVGVLELVFALFLAVTIWTQYRKVSNGSDES